MPKRIAHAKIRMERPREEALDSRHSRPVQPNRSPTSLHRGTNQSGMREHNERLVLSLVRQHGSLSKSDIARMTSLSAQTVSVIMRELEKDGLLSRGEPQRGKIGQPSIPMSLNPDGAYFLGLKIGRRSAELVLIDFVGQVRAMRAALLRLSDAGRNVDFATRGIGELRGTGLRRRRTAGLPASASPCRSSSGTGPKMSARRAAAMEAWRQRDIRAELQALSQLPGLSAERCVLGLRRRAGVRPDRRAARFHLFLHRRLCRRRHRAQRRLHVGPTGNAGALGSMPVPGPKHTPVQLIDVASLAVLEQANQGRRQGCLLSLDVAGRLGRPGAGLSRLAGGRRARAWPMPSSRPPR